MKRGIELLKVAADKGYNFNNYAILNSIQRWLRVNYAINVMVVPVNGGYIYRIIINVGELKEGTDCQVRYNEYDDALSAGINEGIKMI